MDNNEKKSVVLEGNLGNDPVKKVLKGKFSEVTEFSMAVNKGDETVWYNVSAWDNLGKEVMEKLEKGDRVKLEGILNLVKTDDKEYNNLLLNKFDKKELELVKGNLVGDLQLKEKDGLKYVSFSVANNISEDKVNFHNVVAFGKKAEELVEIASKGNKGKGDLMAIVGFKQVKNNFSEKHGKEFVNESLVVSDFKFMDKKKIEDTNGVKMSP